MKFVISIFLSLVSYVALWSQISPMSLHYMDRIDHAPYYLDWSDGSSKVYRDSINTDSINVSTHSSVLPMIPFDNDLSVAKSRLTLAVNKPISTFRLYPITELMAGSEFSKYSRFLTTGGLGFGMEFQRSKLFLRTRMMPYFTVSPAVADKIQSQFQMDAGTNRSFFPGSIFYRADAEAIYRPNKFFTLWGGFGKNFFGEGYRSLLLSDNGASNPYAKIETTFGTVKYVNLYQVWTDNTVDPGNRSLDKMKFSASHYLSWNVTKHFNFSVFESVVWQAKDTLLNRGFDLNYLNPIVFYRPVEYSSGSADNVLLGMNTSVKINRKNTLYVQVLLDEFLLSEVKARSHWWGNKFGAQIGYKTNKFIVDGLYFQTEFNTVRPFTYSHKHSPEAYGNMNASVTHPLGANFFEILNILSYRWQKVRLTHKFTFASTGYDTDSISYGQNIFAPYGSRDGDYDHLVMQGLRTNLLNETIRMEYPFIEKIGLFFNLTYNYRMQWTPINRRDEHYILVGIRSRLWNRYTDY